MSEIKTLKDIFTVNDEIVLLPLDCLLFLQA